MSKLIQRSALLPVLALALAWVQGAPESPKSDEAAVQGAAPPARSLPERPLPESPLPPQVALKEVWKHPSTFIGQTLVVRVQIHSRLSSWNPLLTRFGDGDFSAWSAWSDEQFPWVEYEFNAPIARFFARKGEAAEWALEDAQIYDRFEISCVVRSALAGRPWLEVLAVKPLVRHLGEGAIIHATRGVEFLKQGAWEAAASEFERASNEGIPKLARAELQRLATFCRDKMPPRTLYQPKGD